MSEINKHDIIASLHTAELGKKLFCFSEVGSTNEVAHELAANGAPHGTVVITDAQSSGRGRLDRHWVSPPGCNLYMSMVLHPDMNPAHIPVLTFVCALALKDAIAAAGVEADLKWPNDLLVGGRKVAGVLAEASFEGKRLAFVVVGAGVNVNMSRVVMDAELGGEVARMATSVSEARGGDVDRAGFAASVINEMEKWYTRLINHGVAHIASQWAKGSSMIGKDVEVRAPDETFTGVAKGTDPEGHLIVETDVGEVKKVIAADVRVIG